MGKEGKQRPIESSSSSAQASHISSLLQALKSSIHESGNAHSPNSGFTEKTKGPRVQPMAFPLLTQTHSGDLTKAHGFEFSCLPSLTPARCLMYTPTGWLSNSTWVSNGHLQTSTASKTDCWALPLPNVQPCSYLCVPKNSILRSGGYLGVLDLALSPYPISKRSRLCLQNTSRIQPFWSKPPSLLALDYYNSFCCWPLQPIPSVEALRSCSNTRTSSQSSAQPKMFALKTLAFVPSTCFPDTHATNTLTSPRSAFKETSSEVSVGHLFRHTQLSAS